MKKLLILLSLIPTLAFAQNDSIAIDQIKELGVYYFDQSAIKKIEPITHAGISAGLLGASTVYEGAESANIVNESPIFYIYIPDEYLSRMSFNKFRMVILSKSGNKRKVKTVRTGFFSVTTGAKSEGLICEKLTKNLYKYCINEKLSSGNYGLFYDYAGRVPNRLYDFDVK